MCVLIDKIQAERVADQMLPAIKIRKATKTDSSAVKAVDSTLPLDAARAEHIDSWLEQDEVLVAERGGQIVGYGTAFTNRQPRLFSAGQRRYADDPP